jgi:hypothetical protein
MSALLAVAALALLFVVFGLLSSRGRQPGSCHHCPGEDSPERCGACPLCDSASEEEVEVES